MGGSFVHHRRGAPQDQRAQVFAQDFAHIRFRQRIEEAHVLGDFVGGELPPAVRNYLGLGKRRARGLGYEQPYRLAGLFVRSADAGTFGDPGAGRRYSFDFVWINVEAGDDDHILLAIDDP